MKIIVQTNERSAEVTIDTKNCYNMCNIKDAVALALQIEGYTQGTIDEFFGRMPDVLIAPQPGE